MASPANVFGTPLTVALFAITEFAAVAYLLIVIVPLGTYTALVSASALLEGPLPLPTSRC